MEKYFDLPGADSAIRCKMYFKSPGQSFRHFVLFCHGFAGHKDNAAAQRLAGQILEKHSDTALLIFNWPAHGDDAHEAISLADCAAYLDRVTEWIRKTYDPSVLDVCATSFGGYLILKYLSEHDSSPFRRICLRCPAIVMYDVLTEKILTAEDLAGLAAGTDALAGFDRKVVIRPSFLEELKREDITGRDFSRWSGRIRIVQGMEDELVPWRAVSTFADRNGISCRLVEGADHRFLVPGTMEIVISSFLDFLEL